MLVVLVVPRRRVAVAVVDDPDRLLLFQHAQGGCDGPLRGLSVRRPDDAPRPLPLHGGVGRRLAPPRLPFSHHGSSPSPPSREAPPEAGGRHGEATAIRKWRETSPLSVTVALSVDPTPGWPRIRAWVRT